MSIEISSSELNFFVVNGIKTGDVFQVDSVVNGPAWLKKGAKLLTPGVDYNTILVTEVIDGNRIKIDAFLGTTPVGVDGRITPINIQYTIIGGNPSKDAQVETIVNLAKSYNNKRTVLVWPPKADWEINGETVTLDGSALAAVTAAAMSGYPAHQSFTNLTFPGPKKLYYSNFYFTPSQLDRLSENGVFVLVQNVEGGQIYARHQKSTSTASIQEEEISITKAVDKVSIDLYSTVKPFIGKYNVNQDLLTQLQDTIKEYLYAAKSKKSAYCGSLIIDYSDLSIRANLEGQNTDLVPGTIEISLTIEVGYPANYININVLVN